MVSASTLTSLGHGMMNNFAHRLSQLSPEKLQELEKRLRQSAPFAEPIAIVGIGCRFPGAPGPDAYWNVVAQGTETVSEIPPMRWDIDEFYDPTGTVPGKMSVRWGCFVDGVETFDSMFFGIAPREAARMDPQQRMLLEVAWEALENGGQSPERLKGSQTGVFIGIGASDYAKVPIQFDDYLERIDAHSGTGNALSIAANRLSYVFDWHGPSYIVDTACSSALVALDLAVSSLREGDCNMALVGGVNAILSPETTIAFSKAKMLSEDGHCRPFDAGANGYVRGEGAGIVVLKRLTDAIRLRDPIQAVIRGTAVNQDGRTSGISAPNSRSQEAVIRMALAQAGMKPEEINHIEAHGTATPLGDSIEMEALCRVFKDPNGDLPTCTVSSVKANIGHLETASGIASLIKVVLMLKHGAITPQANLTEINSYISLDQTRLRIPVELESWGTGDAPRVAGISCFGFGGTNAHAIVEQATLAPVAQQLKEPDSYILALSGKTEAGLQSVIKRYLELFESNPKLEASSLCHWANSGRSHFQHRVGIVGRDIEKIRARLTEHLEGETLRPRTGNKKTKLSKPLIAFLFTGQGAQYPNMGKSLFETQPLFRQSLLECDRILKQWLDRPLLSVLYPEDGDESFINETAYTQPALFCLEYSLAMLWRSWGIEPGILLGHSVGEYVAACLAGVISMEDGLKLIARRASLMQRTSPDGLMAVLGNRPAEVEKLLGEIDGRISIAVRNGPENSVVSGDANAVRQAVVRASELGWQTQELNVSHAFHSPLMDEILDDFTETLRQIKFRKPRVPIISNLTGKAMMEAPDANYWRDHLRQSVRFADGMQVIAEKRPDHIIEVGPSPTLIGMGRQCVPNSEAQWLPSLRKGQSDWRIILGSVVKLYEQGVTIRWPNVRGEMVPLPVELPTYPFDRKRYWMEELEPAGHVRVPRASGKHHPLLGSKISTPTESDIFEVGLSESAPSYLVDHRIQGSTVTPAAAYLEQALEAADQVFGPGRHSVEALSLHQAMTIPEGMTRRVQVTTTGEHGGVSTFHTYSQLPTLESPDPIWTLHATARLRHESITHVIDDEVISLADLMEQTEVFTQTDQFYDEMALRGLVYGERFRCLSSLRRGERVALATIELPSAVASEIEKYHVHPALLDAGLQAIAAVLPMDSIGAPTHATYMPTAIEELTISGEAHTARFALVKRTDDSVDEQPDSVWSDITFLDSDGHPVLQLKGVCIKRLGLAGVQRSTPADWTYRINWVNRPLEPRRPHAVHTDENEPLPRWLVFADDHGMGDRLITQMQEHGDACIGVRVAGGDLLREDNGFRIDPLNAEHYATILNEVFLKSGRRCAGIIHLWNLDIEAGDAFAFDDGKRLGWGSLLKLVQSVSRASLKRFGRLHVCTRSAQRVMSGEAICPLQSVSWGMGRTTGLEHPELNCRMIDLDIGLSSDDAATLLLHEADSDATERQIAYRGTQRFVARLEKVALSESGSEDRVGKLSVPSPPYRLELREPGSFDSLEYATTSLPLPRHDQVQLKVAATGLNFSDVLKAMGLYPGITDAMVPLGVECSGVVTAVGQDTTRFKVGDQVFGVVPYSFASHAVTAEYALSAKPPSLTHADTATIPITFLTAHYALRWLGRLQKGERVLIHAAAGGVGLAAIQIAQALGTEVFATAGSAEKQAYISGLGVKYVYNSRNTEFCEQIRKETGREGVDVVLNSLPGEAITKSLSLLRAYGRFLEIGKIDIYQNSMIGLLPFQDNLSYFAIDLDRFFRQRPDDVCQLFSEVMEQFETQTYRPLPKTLFGANETADAYRYMAQRKNIGKVVVEHNTDSPLTVETSQETRVIRSDATYLVTGGTGAVGMQLAGWLADQGATEAVLISRYKPTNASFQERCRDLHSRGLNLTFMQTDVSCLESVTQALEEVRDRLPPIHGVFHLAGTLTDGIMYDMRLDDLDKPILPKANGAWNLHLATTIDPLDCFVLFSSVASTLGSPGQANYSAANAFLDGFAEYRRAAGLPAISISWGPWAESGMASRGDRGKQLEQRGMRLLPPEGCLALLEQVLQHPVHSHLAIMDIDWSAMARQFGSHRPMIFEAFDQEWREGRSGSSGAKVDHEFLEQLRQSLPEQHQSMVETYLSKELGRIMGIDPEDLENDQPLANYGVDSLMAMELKTNLEQRLKFELPMSQLMEGPSIASLSRFTADAFSGNSGDVMVSDAQSSTVTTPIVHEGRDANEFL